MTLAQVFRMTETEAETAFRNIRWHQTDGDPVCPHCGGLDAYSARRKTGNLRFRCKQCGKDFSLTSGTLFAAHKAPLRAYLAAIAVFMNELKARTHWPCRVIWACLTRLAGFLCINCARQWRRNSRAVPLVARAK